MSSVPSTSENELLFEPEKGSGATVAAGIVLVGLMAVGLLVLPFLSEEGPSEVFGLPSWAIYPAALVGMFMIVRLLWQAYLSARKRYILDPEKIRQVSKSGETLLRWDDVADIKLEHPLNGAMELQIELIGKGSRTRMKIPTDSLPQGGRPLLAALETRLGALFERKVRDHLEGRARWQFSFIKDVARLEGQVLHVEFPKLKKHAIPLAGIVRVEWLPGALSGSAQGYVLIRHADGEVKLPQGVRGVHYLTYALKYMYGLGDRVNPPFEEVKVAGVGVSVAKLRVRETRFGVMRWGGLVLGIAMTAIAGWMVWEALQDLQTDQIGIPTEATVAAKQEPNLLVLSYTDGAGKARQEEFHAERDFYAEARIGDTIDVKVHPMISENVVFDGKVMANDATFMWLIGIAAGVALVGFAVGVTGMVKIGKVRKEIAAAEAARPPPPPPLARGAPPVPGVALPATGSGRIPGTGPPPIPASALKGTPTGGTAPFQAGAPTKECVTCGSRVAGDYFLSAGQVWCPACRTRRSDEPEEAGKAVFFKAALCGYAGAVAAAAVWAAVIIATGYELGLVAILVGLIVGAAVKWGAGGARGRPYQILAMVLTFLGLSYAMIPAAIHTMLTDEDMKNTFKRAMRQAQGLPQPKKTPASDHPAPPVPDAAVPAPDEPAPAPGTVVAAPDSGRAEPADPPEAGPDGTTGTPTAPDEPAPSGEPGVPGVSPRATPDAAPPDPEGAGPAAAPAPFPERIPAPCPPQSIDERLGAKQILLALLFIVLAVVGIVLLVVLGPPLVYLAVLVMSPLSIVFLGIALWEAWRINRAQERSFQGPYNDQGTIDFDKVDAAV